jgi:F-type H+-transporting ATPase subunit delta
MRNRAVAARYAQALLTTAKKGGTLDGVAESFAGVMEVLDANPNLEFLLTGPQVNEAKKKSLITTLFTDRIEPVLMHFLDLLVEKQRMVFVREIQDEFARIVEIEHGFTRATVTTAIPLPEDLENNLVSGLGKMTGRKIKLETTVDPTVIGGVCVTMGDRVIDGTIRTNLDRLRTQLGQADVR